MHPITSFSGTHPYQEAHLVERIAADGRDGTATYYSDADEQSYLLDELILEGHCPRCGDLMPEDGPPAGSRVTTCRCVPICSTCGADEATAPISPAQWRPDDEDFRAAVRRRVEERQATAKRATLDMGESGPTILDEHGVTTVRLREHPGGWAEHGFDE